MMKIFNAIWKIVHIVVLRKAIDIVTNYGYEVSRKQCVWKGIAYDDNYCVIKGTLEEYYQGDSYYYSPQEYGMIEDVQYYLDGSRDVLIKLA